MEYFPHGGPGYILSAGLFQNVTLEVMEACLAEGAPLETPFLMLSEEFSRKLLWCLAFPADGLPTVCVDGRELHSCLQKASHTPSPSICILIPLVVDVGTPPVKLGVISCPCGKLCFLDSSRWVWASLIQTRSGIPRGSPSSTRCPPPS